MYEYEKPGNQYHYTSSGDFSDLNGRPFPHGRGELVPVMIHGSEKPPKKNRGAGKLAAAVAGLIVISGISGGGAAYLVAGNIAAPVAAETEPVTQNVLLQTAATGTGGASETGSIAAVAEKCAASVVEITTEVKINSPFIGQAVTQGAGSGVVVTQDGYVITNCHVVDGAENVTVRTKDGSEYAADIVAKDTKTDLCVLKIDASGLSAVTFADSDSIHVGELAVAIGNPLGELGGTVTSGIISATGRELTIEGESMTLLQTSAAVNPGNSGGGLFDGEGKLVGIVNAKSSGSEIEGLGFAIPSNTVKTVVDELMQNGYVSGRPELGISVIEVSDPRTAAMYRLNEIGVYIARAPGDSEFAMGDRIISIGDREIASCGDISAVLQKHKVGDTLNITVQRGDNQVTFDLTLREQVPEKTGTSI